MRDKERCRLHGGAAGSGAQRGNRNALKTGLYSRHLRDSTLAAYVAGQFDLDKLDKEIALARANLDWAVEQWMAHPDGGVIQSRGGQVIRERLWIDIVREHVDNVRKIIRARADLVTQGDPESRGALRAFMARVDAGEYEP